MFDRVWTLVVEGSYPRIPAVLRGYERKAVRGEVYPVIYPAEPFSQIWGIVYSGVSASDLARLDIFEGEYYFRKTEQVITDDKRTISAAAYVLKEEYYPIISHRDWDVARFETVDIDRFIDNYIGFIHGGKRLH